jgi:hypothetical protein
MQAGTLVLARHDGPPEGKPYERSREPGTQLPKRLLWELAVDAAQNDIFAANCQTRGRYALSAFCRGWPNVGELICAL